MRRLACVVVLLELLAAGPGCGDVEVRGRLVASAGPSYADGEYRFWDPYGSWQDSFDEGALGADGSFSGMVPESALRTNSVELLLGKGGTSFQLEVGGFPNAAPDHVDLGDLVLWNPGLRLDRGDDGVIVHWTPPPKPVAASAELGIAGIDLDPNAESASVPAYLIEDRHAAILVVWEPAIQSSHLRVMASAAMVEAAPYSPSAAAGAPCFAYRVDPDQGERRAALMTRAS